MQRLCDDSFDDLIDYFLAGGDPVIRVGLGQGGTHRNHGSVTRTNISKGYLLGSQKNF